MKEEDDIPTLGYASGPPRSMKRKIAFAASVGAAGITVAVAGMTYRARMGRPVPLGGTPPATNITWQTQPTGNGPATQPAGDDLAPETAPETASAR